VEDNLHSQHPNPIHGEKRMQKQLFYYSLRITTEETLKT